MFSASLWILLVRIVLEGVDKYNNLIGSVYYPDGDSAKDLPLELVQNVSPIVLNVKMHRFILSTYNIQLWLYEDHFVSVLVGSN